MPETANRIGQESQFGTHLSMILGVNMRIHIVQLARTNSKYERLFVPE